MAVNHLAVERCAVRRPDVTGMRPNGCEKNVGVEGPVPSVFFRYLLYAEKPNWRIFATITPG
jgi:hypothetical protein